MLGLMLRLETQDSTLKTMSLTLYHVAWCPDCDVVRRKLAELHIDYEQVVVPDFRPMRKAVHEVSGQYYVPVLKDGEIVLTETDDILNHLDQTYGQERITGR
jgi:mycoredoxin